MLQDLPLNPIVPLRSVSWRDVQEEIEEEEAWTTYEDRHEHLDGIEVKP